MANQVIIDETRNQISVIEGQTRIIEVAAQGPQGPVGPRGEAGPSGSSILNQITSGSVTASVDIGSAAFTVTRESSNLFHVGSSGNVGIGLTSPNAKLHVSGSTILAGSTTIQGNQFNAGTYWNSVSGSNLPSGPWRGLAYGNGLFVAVASRGGSGISTTQSIATSPDGVNWTFRTIPSLTNLTNITYQNGMFIAIGAVNQRAFYSYDGINWANATNMVGIVYGITYGKDKFVACKIDNPGFRINISYDGKNWQGVSTPSTMDLSWVSVTYGNDRYVAVAESTVSGSIAISYDGITWNNVTRPLAGTATTYNICYGKGLFVVTCNQGKILTSPDGINWTARDTPLTGLIWKCIFAEGVFIAAGAFSSTQNRFIYSTDGITWQEASTPALNDWSGFAYGNGLLLSVTYNGTDSSALVVSSGVMNSFVTQNDNITHGRQTFTDNVILSGSLNVTGSQNITGPLNVTGSLLVTGNITAQTLVVQTITSSVLYSSGSNIFGNSLTNTQQFTGSVSVTGSSVSFNGSSGLNWDGVNNRLGIGTNAPTGVLNIVANDATVFLRNTGSNSYAGVNMNDDTNTLAGSFQIGGTGVGTLAGHFFFGARRPTGRTIIVGGALATPFATMFSTGNFLIQNGGTHSDTGERLQVSGSAKITDSLVVTGSITSLNSIYSNGLLYTPAGIFCDNNLARFRHVTVGVNQASSTGFIQPEDGTQSIGIRTGASFGGTTRLLVTSTGNVLINNTVDDTVNRLQVTGTSRFVGSSLISGSLLVTNVSTGYIIEARNNSGNSGGFNVVGNNVEVFALNAIVGFVGSRGSLDLRGYSGGSTGNVTTPAATIADSFNYNASSTNTSVLRISPAINQTGTAGYTLLDLVPTINTTGSGISYYIKAPNFNVLSTGDTQISGSARITNGLVVSGSTSEFVSFVSTAGSARLKIDSVTASPNAGFGLAANGVIKWSLASYGATSDFTFYNEALNRDALFIKGTTNNVIIGSTADSGDRLQVSGSSRFNGNVLISGSGATSGTNGLLVQNSSTVSTFIVRNDGRVSNGDSTFYVDRYTVGGTTVVISNAGHNGATGIQVTSAVGIRAYSSLGISGDNLLGASIYAAGGRASASYISLGLLSNRALITSVASGMNMHTSSMLQVDSTDQGFLPPRMTTTQKNAITTPAAGLVVYDTTLAKLCVYTTTWETITSS